MVLVWFVVVETGFCVDGSWGVVALRVQALGGVACCQEVSDDEGLFKGLEVCPAVWHFAVD